jgi:hypothetical protein
MKRPIPGKQLPKPDVKPSDAQSIDVKYGLEPRKLRFSPISSTASDGSINFGNHVNNG